MKKNPSYSHLEKYESIADSETLDRIKELSSKLQGIRVLHVNSTRMGGGVAEILHKLVPLLNDVGIETSWEVITGENDFYRCTKSFHNAIQGGGISVPDQLIEVYEQTVKKNAEKLKLDLESADIIIIHDPQPCALKQYSNGSDARWIWRCHIDASSPNKGIWNYLKEHIEHYDGSIFSTRDFIQPMPHNQHIITPSIDPLSDKNVDIKNGRLDATYKRFNLDRNRPIISQISRFDRFKDPVGVIESYNITREKFPDLQLVLAGGEADDDPEGAEVIKEVYDAAGNDKDIHILILPPDSNMTINAIQRISDIIIQKSLKEGFGLTVTEGLWKEKPVIGGNTGGIRTQIRDNHNGFLVSSIEETSSKIEYLLSSPAKRNEFGKAAKEHVSRNFLITRHLLDYLELINEYSS